MADQSRNPVEDIVTLLGTLGEMAHIFYTSMLKSGADRQEATAGMQSFITVWWSDSMSNARRENREREAKEHEQDE